MVKADWDRLPNEMKCHIKRYTDLASNLALSQCSHNDYQVFSKFPYKDVIIGLNYPLPGTMIVTLYQAHDGNTICKWKLSKVGKKNTSFVHMNFHGIALYTTILKKKAFSKVAFNLVGKFCNDERLAVRAITLRLRDFNGEVDFGVKLTNFRALELLDCINPNTIKSILDNFTNAPFKINIELDTYTNAGFGFNFNTEILPMPKIRNAKKLFLAFTSNFSDADLLTMNHRFFHVEEPQITIQGFEAYLMKIFNSEYPENAKNQRWGFSIGGGNLYNHREEIGQEFNVFELVYHSPAFMYINRSSKHLVVVVYDPLRTTGYIVVDFEDADVPDEYLGDEDDGPEFPM